jgi:hypothetical protein
MEEALKLTADLSLTEAGANADAEARRERVAKVFMVLNSMLIPLRILYVEFCIQEQKS